MREKIRRRIRAAGWAAIAFAVFQLLAFPAVVWRRGGHWTWEPTTVLDVLPAILLGWFALRGSRPAAWLLGAYAVYRIGLFGLGIVRVLDGTAVVMQFGPARMLASAVVLPFAIFRLRGGIAALRAMPDADPSETAG